MTPGVWVVGSKVEELYGELISPTEMRRRPPAPFSDGPDPEYAGETVYVVSEMIFVKKKLHTTEWRCWGTSFDVMFRKFVRMNVETNFSRPIFLHTSPGAPYDWWRLGPDGDPAWIVSRPRVKKWALGFNRLSGVFGNCFKTDFPEDIMAKKEALTRAITDEALKKEGDLVFRRKFFSKYVEQALTRRTIMINYLITHYS